MGKYDFPLNMDANDTNPKIINRVRNSSEVLEFGAANGRMTKFLSQQKQCLVDIVEIDDESGRQAGKFARESCLGEKEGNIENFIWAKKYCQRKYDFIIFADVLEHLSDPAKVLSECKKVLKESGKIIVSIPNIAHNAIIYQLLNDEFQYKETGLLDKTHIHFFTMNSFRNMVNELGYYIADEDAVCRQLDETEFDISLLNMDNVCRSVLSMHREGLVYQGIFVLVMHEETSDIPFSCTNISNQLLFAKMYFQKNGEENFSEKNSVVVKTDFCGQEVVFDLDCEVEAVRIDPMNDKGMIRIKQLKAYAENNDEIDLAYVTNGRNLKDNVYVFGVNKPQILINNIGQYVSKILFDYDVISYAAGGMEHIADLVDERNHALSVIEEQKRVINHYERFDILKKIKKKLRK